MPELPEVETTRRGVAPHITGRKILKVNVYEPRLRWPVPADLPAAAEGKTVQDVTRRAKYLLINLGENELLFHLGMSGNLRIVAPETPRMKHDHVDILLEGDITLRYNDPRRFGCLLLLNPPTQEHPLLRHLGPEPLSDQFSGELLYKLSRQRKSPVKTFLMDQAIVVGVGNIYANEALFLAGIRPTRPAGEVSLKRYQALADAVRKVLSDAINMGGTTLRDFVGGDGKPGYFQQTLRAYGRGGQPCILCKTELKEIKLGQRASVFCPSCQR
ncbi:bifunctional DNA-formamidopyrimidine glycosylase/DNA-(apurinic or apyrimidinic site) lyase [Hahella sp. HN01]|uniref:bifunctional DNA-formamidopyrimidine glycosylase/DNA-(apurinic or apyrimidinic site) lyase n=1 Tax=Hahella sp. HN01 TaxID=2847262 RepID=UPI001C1E9CED|nr:bifunctional DNA-formamidopyrimidine glycosylase/DNA-(apurinic or apyrimidinic site) lyase [Hahella sp. HN01]